MSSQGEKVLSFISFETILYPSCNFIPKRLIKKSRVFNLLNTVGIDLGRNLIKIAPVVRELNRSRTSQLSHKNKA